MKQTKTILRYVFHPKLIIFCLALFDFLYFWYITINWGSAGSSFCMHCPWYYRTANFSHVIIILLSASFLLINKWWSYAAAIAFSGYIVVYGLNLFINRQTTLLEQWKFAQEYEPNVLLLWEAQFVLAVIIFSLTIFYLIRAIPRKDVLR